MGVGNLLGSENSMCQGPEEGKFGEFQEMREGIQPLASQSNVY